jgi:PAS domain-containing protein
MKKMKAKLAPHQSSNEDKANDIHWRKSQVKKIVETQKTANHQHRILSAVINTIPNPAFYRNAAGIFVDCNTAFADTILGTACENIVGQAIYDLPDIIPQALTDLCAQHDECNR